METIKLKGFNSHFLSDMMYSLMEYIHQNPDYYYHQEFEIDGRYCIISGYGEELPWAVEDHIYDNGIEFEMYTPYMGILRIFCGHYLKVDNKYYFLSEGAPGVNMSRLPAEYLEIPKYFYKMK